MIMERENPFSVKCSEKVVDCASEEQKYGRELRPLDKRH